MELTNEIWHHCEVPYTRYEVSNLGRVRNAHTGMKIRPFLDKDGYHLVHLYYKGGYKHQFVHRLVALAFVPGWRKEFEVNHKNGVKTDNRAENLEWVTHRENCIHGVDVLLKMVKPVALFDERGHLQRIYPSSQACNRVWGRCVRSAISTQNRYRGFMPLYISVPMYREIVHLVNVHCYTLQAAFIEASLNLKPTPNPSRGEWSLDSSANCRDGLHCPSARHKTACGRGLNPVPTGHTDNKSNCDESK